MNKELRPGNLVEGWRMPMRIHAYNLRARAALLKHALLRKGKEDAVPVIVTGIYLEK